MIKRGVLISVLLLLLVSGGDRVRIHSHQEIPIAEGLFRMGPSTGFPVPFELMQSFDVPPGATRAYGTIAWGPCQAAEFMGATSGYTTGGHPTQACSWIMWEPAPATVTVTAGYVGHWLQNYVSSVCWFAWEDGAWVPYCLLGDPDQHGNCPASLYLEAQPITVYFPVIMKGG